MTVQHRPPALDIAPDLTLRLGGRAVRVTPREGLALAQSLISASVRQLVLAEAEAARATRPVRAPLPRRMRG